MLNLNGSLTKASVKYSTLWSEDFDDNQFRRQLKQWLTKGRVRHNTSHVTSWSEVKVSSNVKKLGRALADQLQREKAIMGVFRRGMHGNVQRDHPRSSFEPHGRLQGTTEPVGTLLRIDSGQ